MYYKTWWTIWRWWVRDWVMNWLSLFTAKTMSGLKIVKYISLPMTSLMYIVVSTTDSPSLSLSLRFGSMRVGRGLELRKLVSSGNWVAYFLWHKYISFGDVAISKSRNYFKFPSNLSLNRLCKRVCATVRASELGSANMTSSTYKSKATKFWPKPFVKNDGLVVDWVNPWWIILEEKLWNHCL